MELACSIAGEPAAQGSKRVVNGVMFEQNDAKLRPWRDSLAWHLARAHHGRPPMEGPVEVSLAFRLRRPARPSKWWQRLGDWHATKPDVDKLTRAVLDALTVAQVVHDDGQVALLMVAKVYVADGESLGVDVAARELVERL